jgi:hypothetical protein
MPPTLPLAAAYIRGSTNDQIDTLTAQFDPILRYCDFRVFGLPAKIEDAALESLLPAMTYAFRERAKALAKQKEITFSTACRWLRKRRQKPSTLSARESAEQLERRKLF